MTCDSNYITYHSRDYRVTQKKLPEKTDIPYRLRTRSHNMTLINKTKFLSDADFLIRMLYKYSYLVLQMANELYH